MPIKKRELLESLSKAALADFARGYDVPGFSTMSKPDLVDALAGLRSLRLAEVLEQLSRDELKAACAAEGLDTSGREKAVLIERLLGKDAATPDTSDADSAKNWLKAEPPAEPKLEFQATPARAGSAAQGVRWGPNNPHPLSTMKTELVWEGKYDEWGNRREVDIAGCAMPMQRIETIDQPRSEAAAAGAQNLIAFEKKTTRVDDFRNRLIWGDNKLVMASLLAEFKGKVDLIYIDPPFNVDGDFTMGVPIGAETEEVRKDQSVIEAVAYRDTWGRGADSYLQMLADRLQVMKLLLSQRGSIFVHVGANISNYVRSVMDDALGAWNFRNEIILPGRAVKNLQQQFKTLQRLQVRHDVLLWYSGSPATRFAPFWIEKHDAGNPEGHWHHFWSNANRPTMRYELFGITPKSGQWVWREERALVASSNYDRFVAESGGRTLADYWRDTGSKLEFIRRDPEDGKPQYWREPAETRLADTMWSGVPIYANSQDYPTEKNEAFLKQVLELASNPGDLVADFFCGSGTTGAVAEKLGRRWIMVDLGRYAVHVARKRMLDVQRELHVGDSDGGRPYRSFDVFNLGRYERQWWQKDTLNGADTEHRRVVLEFFKAEILDPAKSSSPLIHGRKGRALVHVDGIDGIFTAAEARAVAQAAAGMGATEVYCLAWDFEMDIRQRMAAIEAETGVKMYPLPIPKEIMERNRKDPPPWLEVAVLEAEPVYRKKDGATTVDIKLTTFLPSLAQIDARELDDIRVRAAKSGFDFIDFWAIDFDWHTDRPFNHHWQDYRTRKDRSLVTVSTAGHEYPKAGTYTACVKVVDVFGCDTSITVPVKV